MMCTTITRSLLALATGAVVLFGAATAGAQTFVSTNGTMTAPRVFHTETLLPDGRVLLTGGADVGATAELYDPFTGTFSQTGPMNEARTSHTATLLNTGAVLIAGGGSSGTSAELFDPFTMIFAAAGNMSSARSNHTATRLTDGRVLLTGGTGQDGLSMTLAEIYDPSTGIFSATGSMLAARAFHTATLLTDGRVLMTGGTDVMAAEIYDPSTGIFTQTGAMTVSRSSHTATLLSTGQVLITGGTSQGNVTLSSAELFDPFTGVFRFAASMNATRTNHTATTLLNGQVLIVGSLTGDTTAELYDPTTLSFSLTSSAMQARAFHTATLLSDGRVLLAGGIGGGSTAELFGAPTITLPTTPVFTGTSSLQGIFRPSGSMTSARQSHAATLLSTGNVLITGGLGGGDSAELFDAFSESFTVTGGMTTVRREHTATALADGRVLVAGGVGVGATAEIYDQETETFSALSGMTSSRSGHTATLLSDGRVLIVGGLGQGGIALSTAEAFDPITNTFASVGSMAMARSEHTATMLSDGRVLITGGMDQSGGALSGVEVYDPSTGIFTSAGNMIFARAEHTATMLSDGRILIAGGVEAGATAELYDTSTQTFTSTSDMVVSRSGHTATLTRSGHVLLVGGSGGGSSAEAFDPITLSFDTVGALTASRELHTATLLVSGQVLIAGGIGILSSTEIFATFVPDVSGTITKAKAKPKRAGNRLVVKVDVNNRGAEAATGPFRAVLHLSDDETLDAQDTFLQGLDVNGIPAGGLEQLKFKVTGLGAIVGMFAIVDIDTVAGEENTSNNMVSQDIIGNIPTTVDVTLAGSGSGVVTSSPQGLFCGTLCTSNFTSGANVTLIATAAAGSVFTGWSGDICNVSTIADDRRSGTCEFMPLTQSRSVTATFDSTTGTGTGTGIPGQQMTLSVTSTGSGTITSTPQGITCGTNGTDCTESFAPGAIVILQASPDSGQTFLGWSGGGCQGTSSVCSVTMNQSRSVTAQFSGSGTTTGGIDTSTGNIVLTVTTSGSGTVTSLPAGILCGSSVTDCTEGFSAGESVILSATPDVGSSFLGWSGGGCFGTSNTCTVTMNQAQTVTAQFSATTGTTGQTALLTVSPQGSGTVASFPAGITCGTNGTDCTEFFTQGTAVVLSATADIGETFLGWSGGGCFGTSSTCTVTMNQAQTVTAQFSGSGTTGATSTLTIMEVRETGGSGTITATGISCGAGGTLFDCTESYATGSVIQLAVSTSSDSRFIGWGGGGCSGTLTTCSVRMTENQTVIAVFEPLQPQFDSAGFQRATLAVVTTGSGSGTIAEFNGGSQDINCRTDGPGNQVCSVEFPLQVGQFVLQATADSGSLFVRWGGACAVQGGTNSLCTITPGESAVVTAEFSETS